jgi:hypothetical protein
MAYRDSDWDLLFHELEKSKREAIERQDGIQLVTYSPTTIRIVKSIEEHTSPLYRFEEGGVAGDGCEWTAPTIDSDQSSYRGGDAE